MSTLSYADGSGEFRTSAALTDEALEADRASRRWRTVWRTHFYAGIFAAPFLVLMAFTGLVILYSQPIENLLQGNLREVTAAGQWQPFDTQAAAVRTAFPDHQITAVVVPRNATTSTSFGLDNGREVFVNPYTAKVLGTGTEKPGIIGLANRIHGQFNNKQVQVSLPSVGALFDDGPVMRKYVVGDMLLEILGGWGIVLLGSGLYLWWPRRTRVAAPKGDRTRFGLRLGKKGRARWRDLHSVPGVVLSGLLLFVLVSGMPWASYWGTNFTALANKVTPNTWVDAPNSSVAKLGDLDRLGNQINWNTQNAAVPNSTAVATGAAGALPAVASLDAIVAAGTQEGMKPGYSISFPANGKDDAGNATFGSFALSNSWPRKTGEAKTVYLDQFSGKTISSMDVYGYGTVSRAADTLVSVHMGTQLGVLDRIAMTLLCVLTLWSVFSAVVMYTKRRRKGTLGLPRRPRDIKMANRLIGITVVMAVLYPLWGVTAFIVLMLDRFVIRRNSALRRFFGQPSRPLATPAA